MAKGNRFLGIYTTLLVPETKRITLEDLTVKDAFLNLCADVHTEDLAYVFTRKSNAPDGTGVKAHGPNGLHGQAERHEGMTTSYR